jgi:DNA polymerase/3'-5' exonuclease PolX
MKARMMAPGGTANAEIARIFREIADQLELRRANQFRIRAYRNAARTVEESGRSIASLALSTPKELQELPGVGADLAGKIVQVVRTGSLPMLTTLARRAPKGATELLRVPRVTAHGTTRAAIQLTGSLNVDLRVVPPESYGAALHYFTGSKAHNIAIRLLGVPPA